LIFVPSLEMLSIRTNSLTPAAFPEIPPFMM
jgi:hypothetical protein